MHELAVTQGILNVALDAARQAGGHPVTAIDLVIGDLSSIVDDSVQFYFDLLSRDTPAAGATLRFRREPAELLCRACGYAAQVVAPLPTTCPACGAARLQVSGGKAFYVESIEVDDESPGGQIDLEQQRPGRRREPGPA